MGIFFNQALSKPAMTIQDEGFGALSLTKLKKTPSGR